ncbi:UNVERIFIED_CONTAM: Protein abhd8 [Gekko kuhli]
MLTSITEGLLCCLMGKTSNAVGPLESIESSDGYRFVEVKPGRVLRVKHLAPVRPAGTEEAPPQSGAGALQAADHRVPQRADGHREPGRRRALGHPPVPERLGAHSTVEVEVSDANGTVPPSANPSASTVKRRRRKPKKTVNIDCTKYITSCKGAHGDVVLFFSSTAWEALRTSGRSSWTSSPSWATSVFKRYAKKRNILIGHSYGVSFCTFLAHEYPDLVHKVIMINGGGPTALEPSLCSIFNMPICVLRCLTPCLAWSFLKAGFARQGAKEKQLLKEGHAFNVSSFVLRAMMSGQYWPEGDEVYHAELTVPVLLVHGMHDKFVPIEEDQRMAEILLIAFLKVIDEGSHMVMMECPETVNTLLHEFLLWEPEEIPAGDGLETEKK